MERGGRHNVPPLEEELLATDSFLEKEYYFSLGMWLLVGQPRSSGWPYTQEFMGSTVELNGLKQKKGDIKLGR